ncbi:MAG: hypothetical protein HC869_10850 [Rhodospirillales bacterium]|nr:hypothetical protein [Rhodospirillales bacterium]
MFTGRSLAKAVCLLVLLAFASAPRAWAVEGAKVDDVARFLAGLEPAAHSPLAPLTRDPAWQHHARVLNQAWVGLEQRRLAKIRTWSTANLTDPKPVVLYMFSGPDFLYVDAFFPNRTTYVMSGLEPVGQVPAVTDASRRSMGSALAGLRESVGSSINYSFFRTKQMRTTFSANRFKGVLPVLYLFLARSGKTIHDVTLIGIDAEGKVVPGGTRGAAQGVKIVFSGGEGASQQTLYYVQTDVSDHGLKKTGFLKFCEDLGVADGFIKSASYLLHANSFSTMRNFLLDRTAALVQDDSGIPVRYFSSEAWRLHPFGRYRGPIALFNAKYQSKLNDVYRRSSPPQLEFGVGYRWRPNESNLLLAVKNPK